MANALDRKRFATLQARAALAGIAAHAIENDHGAVEFIACRWALTKSLPTLDALEIWLATVTGTAGNTTKETTHA